MAHQHSDPHHEHELGHDHGHDHGHAPASFGRAFALGIGLNIAYVAGEAFWGVVAHSTALLADAGHNLGDVLGLAAAWLAQSLGRRSPSGRFTYGLRRSSILSALGNAVVLLLVTGGIAWEAIQRLITPAPVGAMVVVIVASVGILVNGGTALLFASGRRGDLNLRGAFLHMASDALMALAVVLAGVAIWLGGWSWIDPAVSLLVAVVIVAGTWSLLRDSLGLALDAVPRGIDRDAVERFLRGLPGVTDLHHLHIWGMSTTETALTAHLVRPGVPLVSASLASAPLASAPLAGAPQLGMDNDSLLHDAAEGLRSRYGIGHATFQIEQAPDGSCSRACGGV